MESQEGKHRYTLRRATDAELEALKSSSKYTKHSLSSRKPEVLPGKVDIRLPTGEPKVYDQGRLGSCSANALCGAFELRRARDQMQDDGNPGAWDRVVHDFTPSRLYTYYNELALQPGGINPDGTPNDHGLAVATSIPVMAQTGIEIGFCHDAFWPYEAYAPSFTSTVPPRELLDQCNEDAQFHQISEFDAFGIGGYNANWFDDKEPQFAGSSPLEFIRHSLFHSYPVIVGFAVYESFESMTVAQTGIMPMPEHSERCLGGHAVVFVGYDDATQHFTVRNSWGERWGQHGHFKMPYAYVTEADTHSDGMGNTYCFDFLALQRVNPETPVVQEDTCCTA